MYPIMLAVLNCANLCNPYFVSCSILSSFVSHILFVVCLLFTQCLFDHYRLSINYGVIYLTQIKYELAITVLLTSVPTITITQSYPQEPQLPNLFPPALLYFRHSLAIRGSERQDQWGCSSVLSSERSVTLQAVALQGCLGVEADSVIT